MIENVPGYFSLSSFIPLLKNTIHRSDVAKILTQQIIFCASLSSTNFPILVSLLCFSHSFALIYCRVLSWLMFYYCSNTFLTPLGSFIFFSLAYWHWKLLKIYYFLQYTLFIEREIHQKVRATEKILFIRLEL